MNDPRSEVLKRQTAAALVVVLAFVVLMTGMVLAFFSRAASNRQVSNSSANQIRAEWMARGAIDQIVGDLKQEIAAGSVVTGSSGAYHYYPAVAMSVVPYRTGTNAAPNLLKWSAYNAKFFDETLTFSGSNAYPNAGTYPPSQRAANLSTATPSLNGRTVSLSRWNKALLLPKAVPSTTDVTPATTGTAAFTAPSWIFVGRDGSNPATSGSQVVGRYAYAIYDEGGLLDMNVAGYRANDSGVPQDFSPAELGRKGGLAAADLTRIGLTGTQTQTLVNWRNVATLQAGGTNYLSTVLSDTTGFLRVSGTNGQSDRAFPSRQSLMSFVLNNFTGTIASRQNMLQYMGVFSRDTNSPSWRPDPNRPKVRGANASDARRATLDSAGNMAAKTDNNLINPAFPDVLVQTAFTRWDGTQANPGEPLVKSRFPLSRLAWLTCNGPSADNMGLSTIAALKNSYGFSDAYLRLGTGGTNGMIYKSFGLTWDSGKHRWIYNHGAQDQILRLDQVAAAGREPDFFELLQAAIHVGSLGSSFTVAGSSNTGPTRTDERYFGDDSKVADGNDIPWVWPQQQIMEIGACMIDQFDLDSFPTEIYFQQRFGSSPFSANYASVFGQENLPTLHRLYGVLFRRKPYVAPAPPEPTHYGMGEFGCYLFPEVWNVNDQAYTPPVTNAAWTPQQLRFEAQFPDSTTSMSMLGTNTFWNFKPVASTGVIDWAPSDFDSREPVVIYKKPNLVVPGPDGLDDLAGVPIVRARCAFSGGTTTMMITNVDSPADVTGTDAYTSGTARYFRGVNSGDIFGNGGCLQFQDPDGNWRPYNRLLHTSINMNNGGVSDPAPSAKQILDSTVLTSIDKLDLSKVSMTERPDPRSDRFPSTRGGAPGNPNASGQTRSMRWATDQGENGTSYFINASSTPPKAWTWGSLRGCCLGILGTNQNTGSMFSYGGTAIPTFYADPDGPDDNPANGIIRGADGMYEGRQLDGSYAATTKWDGRMMASGTNAAFAGGRNYNRPIILNRPFRSVGELGYAFRGAPWKSIDFFSANSGDAALLDVFCLREPPSAGMTAGVVNLNTRNAAVIEAVLAGGVKDETMLSGITDTMPVPLTSAQIGKIRDTLINLTSASPLKTRGELVTRFIGSDNAFPLQSWGASVDDDAAIVKRRREATVRALADVATTRTWNLMIDVIAQSGRCPTFLPGQFIVEGEKRYWVHLAIDRIKGEVIDSNWEPVSE